MDEIILNDIVCKQTEQHPLRLFHNQVFYKNFEREICALSIKKNIDSKIEELIKDNGDFSVFKYNQGIAEFLFWFLMNRKKVNYDLEVSVNGTKKNVDVQAVFSNITYNIEAKSPEYYIRKDGELVGMLAHRFESKEAIQTLKEIENLFRQGLLNSGYDSIRTELSQDNKVKDCLQSAHKKFDKNSETNCNVLFLCTTTGEFIKYLDYLVNTDKGFLSPNSYVPHKEFDKVKAVVLSNAISLNNKHDTNSWDLSKAINIILFNPFCEYKNNEIAEPLLDLIPNITKEFCQELNEFIEKQNGKKEPFPVQMFYPEFVANHGYNLNQEPN